MIDMYAIHRRQLYHLLGDLPPRRRRLHARTVSVEERPGYVLEKLVLDLNGLEPVPAYFARPRGQSGRVPAILYNHAHGGNYALGKEEFVAGREGMQLPPYAEFLTARGIAGLCIDTWAFGERAVRSEMTIFKSMLWQGQVMWGMMVYDSLRALDYLAARPEVDARRLGTLGMSMGSTMAWWTAALDVRLKVCIDLCCLTEFLTFFEKTDLSGHGIYYFVPRLLPRFSTGQINAIIAPRAHLGLAGLRDGLTPVRGLDLIDEELKQVYAIRGVPERWKLFRQDVGHCETPEMRAEIQQWLDRML